MKEFDLPTYHEPLNGKDLGLYVRRDAQNFDSRVTKAIQDYPGNWLYRLMYIKESINADLPAEVLPIGSSLSYTKDRFARAIYTAAVAAQADNFDRNIIAISPLTLTRFKYQFDIGLPLDEQDTLRKFTQKELAAAHLGNMARLSLVAQRNFPLGNFTSFFRNLMIDADQQITNYMQKFYPPEQQKR